MSRSTVIAASCVAGGLGLLGTALFFKPVPVPGGSSVGAGWVNGRPVLVPLTPIAGGKLQLRKDAAAAFSKLEAAARAAGHTLKPTRAFATMAEQEYFFNLFKRGKGNLAAKPGHSNHQGGIAVDITVGGTASAVYRWLAENAGRFGFVRTVKSEPWHWEFRPGAAAPPWQALGGVQGLRRPARMALRRPHLTQERRKTLRPAKQQGDGGKARQRLAVASTAGRASPGTGASLARTAPWQGLQRSAGSGF